MTVLPGFLDVYLEDAITADYSVDCRTGRIDFNTAPDAGVEVTADYRKIEYVGTRDGDDTAFYLDHPPSSPWLRGDLPGWRSYHRLFG